MGLRKQYQEVIRTFEIVSIVMFTIVFLFFKNSRFFFTLIIISLILFIFPNWLVFYLESLRRQKLEQYFPDFIRDLASAIKSGKPLPLALGELLDNDYGALNPYIERIYYQVQWGIPVAKAFQIFAVMTDDPLIDRAIATIIEAVKSGGELDIILDSVHKSLLQIKIIEEERKSMVYKQVVQNYIIFFVFLMIMIILQNMLLPTIQDLSKGGGFGSLLGVQSGTGERIKQHVDIRFDSVGAFINSLMEWLLSIEGVFMSIIVIQGFFTGIIIGKLSTGNAASGTKHSFILISIGMIIMSIAQSLMRK